MTSDSTVILITGANSGVGYASTDVISKASPNYHVIMASRNAENGQKALEEIQAMEGVKGTLSTLTLDVDDQASITEAAKTVEKQFGRVDVMVNNAGISYNDMSRESFEKTLRTNVIGPAQVAKAFEHLLLKSKNPYSIYISSSLGSFDRTTDVDDPIYNAGWVTYRTSKAALNMWVVEEVKVLSKQGVKTFAMCPGYVVSNLRGKSEIERSGWGYASDPRISGETLLSIIQGKRDADVGRFVHKDGVYGW